MQESKTIQDLAVGDKDSMTVTLTEEHVVKFAEASGDFNPIHMDDEYAEKSAFGKRVVHGVLLAGVVSGLLGTKFPGLGTIAREMSSKFSRPVYLGETITATAEVAELNEKLNICKLNYSITNEAGKTVMTGKATVLPRRS